MGRHIGSQYRETLEASGYTLHERLDHEFVLLQSDTGQVELWIQNDHYAGYVVEIDGAGYEFVASVTAAERLKLSAKTVYKMVRTGELGSHWMGGQIRIPVECLEELRRRPKPQPKGRRLAA
jgi:excisionase family DNA binding protein